MDAGEAVGFWSYAHSDNKNTRGRILELAQHLQQEYELLAGRPINIFIDNSDLQWGDVWRERIDSRLGATTFLIPIITPTYFGRQECRRELLQFAGQAESLGLREFVLPILFAPVPNLSSDNADEAIALVSRMQYADWRHLRLTATNSAEYQVAVNSLASRLIEIGEKLAVIQFENDKIASADEEVSTGPEDGLIELLHKVDALIPSWLDAVRRVESIESQVRGLGESFTLRDIKYPFGSTPSNANKIRLVQELRPLLALAVEAGRDFSARTIEMDPLVTQVIHIVQDDVFYLGEIQSLLQSIDEAVHVVRVGDIDRSLGLPGLRKSPVDEFLDIHRRLSKKFTELKDVYLTATKYATEGFDIVTRWNMQFTEVIAAQQNKRLR
jgi:TIR domain